MPLFDLVRDPKTTEEYIADYTAQHPDSLGAFNAAVTARKASPAAAQNLNLRDAEHALFAEHVMDRFGPIGGAGFLGVAVPGYTGAKVAAQSFPKMSGIPAGLEKLLGMPLTEESGATRPDLRELFWGLRPAFGSIRK